MSAVFHIHNKEAKRKLKAIFNNEILLFCLAHKSPRVMLDRTLTYRWHFPSLPKRLTSPVALVGRFSGSGVTFAFVHYTAVYSTPAQCRSAHTCLTDLVINDTSWIVTWSMCPTPADNLPILTAIQPAELRRNRTTLSLAFRAMEPRHLLHSTLTCPLNGNERHLQSRHPFVPATQQLISSYGYSNNQSAAP